MPVNVGVTSRRDKNRNGQRFPIVTFRLLAPHRLITVSAVASSQAAGNPKYPQDRSWDVREQGANGGGAGGGGGGGD